MSRDRRLAAARMRATVERVRRELVLPTFGEATVVATGDHPRVTYDEAAGQDDVGGQEARLVGGQPGVDQRVLVVRVNGTPYVLGPLGSHGPLLGGAVLSADSAAFTSEVVVDSAAADSPLTCEVPVDRGRAVMVFGKLLVRSGTTDARVAMRCRRGESVADEQVDSRMDVQTVTVAGSDLGPMLKGWAMDQVPDDGPTSYSLTVSASASSVVEGSVSEASMWVFDAGPSPVL